MRKKENLKRKKGIALTQAIILVLSTIAFAHILGDNVGFVGAQGPPASSEKYHPPEESQAPPGAPIPPSAASGAFGVSGSGGAAQQAAAAGGTQAPLPKLPTKGFLSSVGGVTGILQAAAYAGAIAGITALVVGLFAPEAATAASMASFAGAFAFQILQKALTTPAAESATGQAIIPFLAPFVIALAIAIVIFFILFTQVKYDLVTFSCIPWDAPVGGRDCKKCNQGDLPCSEYRCKALGQACDLVNPGTTEELCVWVNPNDVKPPVIEPWEDVLTDGYVYVPNNVISPPDRGVKIVPENNTNGCVEAFTPLEFGVTLDEAAKCRIDPVNKPGFDNMSFWFGGSSTSKYNHSQQMSLPSPAAVAAAAAAQNITIQNNGIYNLFVRCQDANGNANTPNFVFNFCVNPGPDTTPPLIVLTSILNGAPIAYNQASANLSVYVNEPAECRWSQLDQDYDNMPNNMSCVTNVLQGIVVNTRLVYPCLTTLTGLKNGEDNDFFFRCKDQPQLAGTRDESDRNTNAESYKFTLVGTRPLAITSIEPNDTTVKDSTDVIKVTVEAETFGGYKDGEAICSYSQTGIEGSFIDFFDTGKTNRHSQDLFLTEGSYTFYIRCIDLGGNADNKVINFNVESDNEAPIVVRVFKEENFLKIITNEEASCVYSISTDNACNYLFEDGIAMQSLENNKHQISWDIDRTFYIKCKDEFGNQPLPNECSIIARPVGK